MIVIKTELKSTNRILTYVPGLSRCCQGPEKYKNIVRIVHLPSVVQP